MLCLFYAMYSFNIEKIYFLCTNEVLVSVGEIGNRVSSGGHKVQDQARNKPRRPGRLVKSE